MLNRRSVITAVTLLGLVAVTGTAIAKGPHKHHNGHSALGGKLKQDGKHEVGKAGRETVHAEVRRGKIVNMSAGTLPAKKVKTKKKMAGLEPGNLRLAAGGEIQLAQTEVWYYGYGFDTGSEEVYYWYPAEDVVATDTWVEYTM